MHIIIGLLGAVVTILFLLNRLAEAGIDLGGLNPFLWQRRRAWQKKYEGNPVYSIDDPMEATALLMVAVAQAEGDLSAEQRREITDSFENEFHLSTRDAASLLTASLHALGDGQEVGDNVAKLLAPSKDRFSAEQAGSCLELLESIARVDGPVNERQQAMIDTARSTLKGSGDRLPVAGA